MVFIHLMNKSAAETESENLGCGFEIAEYAHLVLNGGVGVTNHKKICYLSFVANLHIILIKSTDSSCNGKCIHGLKGEDWVGLER